MSCCWNSESVEMKDEISMPGVAPEPVPRPKPNTETRRYIKYEETPGYDRDIDEPRRKCKITQVLKKILENLAVIIL